MPSKQELLQEIANRGLQDQLPPQKRVIFDEAVRRGLVQMQQPGGGQLPQQTPEPQNLQAAPGIQQQTTQPGAPAQPAQAPGDTLGPQLQTANQGRPSFAQPQATALENLERQKQQLPTQAEKELNEVSTQLLGPAFTAKFATAMALGASDEELEDMLRKHPRVALQQDEGGNTIVNFLDEGGDKVIQRGLLNPKGIDSRDVLRFGGVFTLFTPVGKLAGLAAKTSGKAALGAAGAAGVQLGSEAGKQVLGSDKSAGEIATDTALASGLGAGSEFVAPVLRAGKDKVTKTASAVIDKFRTPKMSAEQVRASLLNNKKAVDAAKKIGVDLLEPQVGDTSDILAMQALSDMDASAPFILKALQKEDTQIASAVKRFLGRVATPEQLDEAGKGAKDAAIKIINAAKQQREEIAGPFYEKAFQEMDRVDISPALRYIDDQLQNHNKGEVRDALMAAKDRLLNAATGQPETAAKPIHNAARELWKLQKNKVPVNPNAQTSLNEEAAAEISNVRNIVKGILRQNKNYAAGDEAFKKASPLVDKLKKGTIGRVANVINDDAEQVAQKIFGGSSSLRSIMQAKKLIKKYDPEAWNGIVRARLNDKFTAALERLKAKDIVSISQFQNEFIRDFSKVMRAMDAPQRQNYLWITRTLAAAARGRHTGSPTAGKQEFFKEVRKSAGGQSIINFLFAPARFAAKIRNIGSAPDNISAKAVDVKFNEAIENLGRAVMDGRYMKEMERIRKLQPGSHEAKKALGQVLLKIESDQEDAP